MTETEGNDARRRVSDAVNLDDIIRQHLSDLDQTVEAEHRRLREKIAEGLTVVDIKPDGSMVTWPERTPLEGDYYRDYSGHLPDAKRRPWPEDWYNLEWVYDDGLITRTHFSQLPEGLGEAIRDWVMDNTTEAQEWVTQRALRRAKPDQP